MSLLRLGKVVDTFEWMRDSIYNIKDIINGRLSPADNFTQVIFRGTSPAVAGTEFTLTHNLKRGKPQQDTAGNWIPGIEFSYWLDGPGSLYESNFANWTDNVIKLKCTDASRGYTIIVR